MTRAKARVVVVLDVLLLKVLMTVRIKIPPLSVGCPAVPLLLSHLYI